MVPEVSIGFYPIRKSRNRPELSPARSTVGAAAYQGPCPERGSWPPFLLLDLHEVAAGKLAALFARMATRDVFDAARILYDPRIDRVKLRDGFIAYGAMNRVNWQTIDASLICIPHEQFRREVQALLPVDEARRLSPEALLNRCRQGVENKLLPFSGDEMELLRLVNEEGGIRPELLTTDPALQERIRIHPGLLWKAQNVRAHRRWRPSPARTDPARRDKICVNEAQALCFVWKE